LTDLFGEQASLGDLDSDHEATTLGGLVSEIEGRIPLPGEVVVLEPAGLKMEVVASTDRLVERLRLFTPTGPTEEQDDKKPSRTGKVSDEGKTGTA
jgi:Mg2+/Co2+ transporter CorC